MFAGIHSKGAARMFRILLRPPVIFFSIFLLIGVAIYDDYGLSFDEEVSRLENGYVNYNYIVTGDNTELLRSHEKYHGPAFEIFLIFIEKTFHLTDDRNIYLARHLATFLLFFLAVIFFYLLSRNYFGSKSAALISCAILILSPRIFSDAFYNSKDSAFLSVCVMSVYFLTRFLKKQNFLLALAFGLATGILLSIRIIGIMIPFLAVLFFILDAIRGEEGKKLAARIGYMVSYLFFSGVFTIFCWPVLWTNPLFHFMAAFSEMSKFPWTGEVRYLGKAYTGDKLPWHYLPVWIFISTPFMYILLFITGIFFSIGRILKAPLKFYAAEKESLIFLSWFFLPLLSVILLGSTVYDGWRHLYFIYPAFVLLAVKGYYLLAKLLKERRFFIGKRILNAVLMLSFVYMAIVMVISHPYQYVYFNFLAGNPEGKFERDYWGLSFRRGLEYILEADSSKKITFIGSNTDVGLNMKILPRSLRERLIETDQPEHAVYFLDNFRWHKRVKRPVEEIFSLKPLNVKIMSVYKLHTRTEKVLLTMNNDFENHYSGWNGYRDTLAGALAYSGSKVCSIDSRDEYSAGISIPYDSLTKSRRTLVVYISLQALALDTAKSPVLVVSVDTKKPDSYFWEGKDLWTREELKLNKWKQTTFEVEIPKDLPSPLEFKAYIWNPAKGKSYIDDFAIKIVEVNY